MKELLGGLALVALAAAIIYGTYWVGKTVSYSIFYEDMVQGTIKELVKTKCIK